jgi:hypothetical protein
VLPGEYITLLSKIEGVKSTMEISDFTDSSGKNDFSVKEFIRVEEKYYAVIKPKGTAYWIRISPSDYRKGLIAYYSARSIQCYPIDGELKDDMFEEALYDLVIE